MRLFAFAFAFVLAVAGADASAQINGRMVQGPTYGTIQRISGETLLIAEIKASCAPDAQLGGGYCFDEAIAAMRTLGVASATVLGVTSQPLQGAPVQGEIFDVRSEAGRFVAAARVDGRAGVYVPRNCFALPGEGVRYDVQRQGATRVAVESQLIVCDGAAPPQPWYASAPAAFPFGRTAPSGPGFWPATSAPVLTGAPQPFAHLNSACPAEAVLRDRLCFSTAIAAMQANPGQREVSSLGAPVQASDGLIVERVDQYVMRMRRNNRLDVDERWFDRALIAAPDGCGLTGPASYQLMDDGGLFYAVPIQQARCGPPMAPTPVAIYEFLGDEVFLITPGSCGEPAQIAHGCGGHVMNYMRQTGSHSLQAISVRGNYAIGTVITFRGAGNIRYEIVRIRANQDYTVFDAETVSHYEAGVRPASGCSLPDNWIPGSEGAVITGPLVARFYTWYACPVG